MYALFLETRAAQQIDRYVEAHGGDAEKIKQKCYANVVEQGKTDFYFKGKTQEEHDNWWVNKCLKEDSHKHYDIDSLFTWSNSPERYDFWERVSDY